METSFQVDYNFVSTRGDKIVWEGYKDISSALRNRPYEEIYSECLKEGAYNFKLIDGALVQMMYVCSGKEISKHRLAFYPNPDVEKFQDDPEAFEENHFGNELFSEIYEKKAVIVPVRFDYDIDKKKYKEHNHTHSHLTLGNYKNCRIPVSKAVTPNRFILFILRNFYFDKFTEHFTNDDFPCNIKLESLLSPDEEKQLHFNY